MRHRTRCLGDLIGSSYSNNKAQEDECDKNPYTFPVPYVAFFDSARKFLRKDLTRE
jgi:hypothetical protein